MKCIKHPLVDAVEPFLIFSNNTPLALCKQDIIDIQNMISFEFLDPAVGEKRIPDNVKILSKADQQIILGYKIDIIKGTNDGNNLDLFLK
jgi:hypothetical protein